MKKICKKCGEEKEIEEFPIHSKNNRRNTCKECYSEQRKVDYRDNKLVHLERMKKYKENNKDKLKEKAKKYVEENKDIIRKKKKEYREKNKEMISEKRKKDYYNNKDVYKEKSKEYRDKNLDKIKQSYEKNKEYYSLMSKKRRELHKEELSEKFKKYYNDHKDYFKERRKKYNKSAKGKKKKLEWCNDYNNKNKHVVLWRSLLRRTIVQLQQKKFDTTLNSLGYSAIELKEHIEKNWLEGMNWNNYGDWHVDHIRSVGTFCSTDLPSVVNALSNLAPMWSTTRIIDGILYEGNLNKGKKNN